MANEGTAVRLGSGGTPSASDAAGLSAAAQIRALQQRLEQALEQQAATAEILRVISSTRSDVQPVLETIAEASLKLCAGSTSLVATYDGELVRVAAFANVKPEGAESIRLTFPRPAGRENATTRAVASRSVAMIPDILEDADYAVTQSAMLAGFRSIVSVPLLRDGEPIGAITVGRPEPGSFAAEEIALLQTFADQAVIAIENVRLLNQLEARNHDLTEALEQQAATGEVLRVISRSPTDVQPVFETIAAASLKLCAGSTSLVATYDGELMHVAALANVKPEGAQSIRLVYPRPVDRGNGTTRAVATRAVVMIPDIIEDPDYAVKETALRAEFRSTLSVPLLRDGEPIGAITVGRPEPGPFAAEEIALLQIFADQAVIAIENVRLFNELAARNRDLTEALEHQTATSEILRVISRSPDDIQPVFEIIGERAEKLCDAQISLVTRVEGDHILLGSYRGWSGEAMEVMKRHFPMPFTSLTATGRCVRNRALVHMPDIAAVPDYAGREAAATGGWRSCLAVPMLREDRVIGAIFVGRTTVGSFPDTQIELLKTFADQAVIAIENVRLFNETKEALERQTATSEILRVISGSPGDIRPVFDNLVAAAARLCRASNVLIQRRDGDVLRGAAAIGPFADILRGSFGSIEDVTLPLNRESVSGRSAIDRRMIHVHDLAAERNDEYPVGRELQRRLGHRTMIATPLVRDGEALGVICLFRTEVKPFSDQQVALLQSFADQAVVAIENVRLFRELAARTDQLTKSVGELKALGEVGQAVSSTLDLETVLSTIVSRATQLAGLDGGAIYEYDEAREQFHLHATDKLPPALVDTLRATPIRKGEGGVLARMALVREPVQVRDIADERSYQSRVRKLLIDCGYRALLAVPLLRDDRLLGGIVVNRNAPGEFAAPVIDLLKTFASQSALAIQNARLFREIEDKSRQLEAASRHKSEFLANMSHELRTPLNAIIGFSEVLAERLFGEINDKQAEYVADIVESGRHLLSLINDILDLSKIEAGRMELDRCDFELPAAIDNALTLVRERAGRHGVALTRDVDPRLGTVNADERKVKQVLLNLLTNALKFTPERGEVAVRAAVANGEARVSVTDTGVGIAAADLEAVFEEFRQVGAAEKKVEGTGLGLPISRKIIELHGGRLWATSEPGRGSTFTFTLPVSDAAVIQ